MILSAPCLIIERGGTMDEQQVKRIPYGISDYTLIREGNYYYVDKSPYLKEIEKAGRYLFFIRPRRFGKSLSLSMMRCYYDVSFKDQFEKLFKGTWIYDNPTEERGNYLVLFLNFSEVHAAEDKIEESFLALIRDKARIFTRRYQTRFSKIEDLDEYFRFFKESSSPTNILGHLIRLVNEAQQKMFVIIDEYDNFSNTLITASGDAAYHAITHGDGLLRSFFNVLKAGTGDVNAPISKLFITGVSPVTMDDVTSGFNIGQHCSLDFNLNQMLGFTSDDVTEMIEYYRKAGQITHSTPELKKLMTLWYGNYIFSADADVPVFNSDMILYFLLNYMKRQRIPDNLIDRNVRIDYGKLRHLIIIDRDDNKKSTPPTTNGNFSKLKQITEDGGTISPIVDGFPLTEIASTSNFNSLLFYFGLLTIDGREGDLYRLKIPNQTIRRLFFDYISAAYHDVGIFSMDLSRFAVLISKMAFTGAWRPLFDFLTQRMKASLALRDLITGEKAVQTFLNVYLGLSDLFLVHTEKELNKGYADILLEPYRAKYPELNISYLLELKYVKAGMTPDDPKLPQIVADAETQIKNYSLDEKFKKAVGNTELIKLVLIFSGHQAIYFDQAAL